MAHDTEQVRIDRWLWAARFFKTRSLAKAAIEGGKVTVDGYKPKPAKEILRGQTITIRRGDDLFTVIVEALADKRGPARTAQNLYVETQQSIEAQRTSEINQAHATRGIDGPCQQAE